MRFENVDTMEVFKRPIITQDGHRVYSHLSEDAERLKQYDRFMPKKGSMDKELSPDKDMQIASLHRVDPITKMAEFYTVMGEKIEVDISKEKTYFESFGMTEDQFIEWMLQPEAKDFFSDETPQYLTIEAGRTVRGSLGKYYQKSLRNELFDQIKNPTSAYTVKIISKNDGGFFVNLSGIRAFMPGSLAAANKIVDFESYIGKDVTVMIEDYVKHTDLFVTSHKKYIHHIWPTAVRELERNVEYTGHVTGSSKFGVFVEFEKIFTGLIQERDMDETLREKWRNNEIKPQMEIGVFIKSIEKGKNRRIHLTTQVKKDEIAAEKEMAKESLVGQIVKARVIQNKPFGALVKIDGVSQLCFLPTREISRAKLQLKNGDEIYLTVDKVQHDTGKIVMRIPS